MKKQILLIATLAALVATSCSKRELDGSEPGLPGQIKVTTTIAGATKAVAENDARLSGVTFLHAQVASATPPILFAGAPTTTGDRDAAGNIKFATPQLYDKATDKISILMGYHPAVVPTNNVVTWTPDGATDILFTGPWSAGKYTAPIATGMEFAHILARIEVKLEIAAGSAADAAIDTWGQITGIEFKNAPTTISLDYNTNATVAAGTDRANFPLLKGDTYTAGAAGAFAPIAITTAGVVASAMLPPTDAGRFTLIVKTEKLDPVSVNIDLASSALFEAGKVHTATLAFNAQDKSIEATTTITPWGPGGDGGTSAFPPPPVILESGKAPYYKPEEVGTAVSYTGYNDLHGENTGSDPLTYTNGKYYTTKALAYAGEPPYYKFEIASEDAYDAVANDKNWRVLQGNHIDNICVQKHGDGWRLPRISELRLMYENRVELNKAVGFTDLAASYYWSATEFNASYAWHVNFSNGSTSYINNKTFTDIKARCVRELPPPPPAIGDYYYSDKTFSPTFDAGKTLLGVIYRLNPDGTGMLVEVTEAPAGTVWSTVSVPTGAASEDSGVDNTNAIKGLDPTLTNYPAFKHCEDKNTGGVTGWYLPANKELRALFAGFSGLRLMATGANTANGEIDDWGNSANMPGNANYTAARTAFNAKMTAAGVDGTSLVSICWSASENNTSNAWSVNFSNGYTYYNYKTSSSFKARCVREIMP